MIEAEQAPQAAPEAAPAVEAPTPAEAPAAAPEAAQAAPAVDLSGQLEALQSQVAELRAAKAAAEAAAEEAAQSKLTEAEKLEQERVNFRAEIEEERARLRGEARSQALQRAGVLPAYHDFVPDLDPRTPDGAKALEAWIGKHPETVARAVETKPSPLDDLSNRSSAVAEILTGKRSSNLVTAKSLAKMFNRG
jgi:hypothetical protein